MPGTDEHNDDNDDDKDDNDDDEDVEDGSSNICLAWMMMMLKTVQVLFAWH